MRSCGSSSKQTDRHKHKQTHTGRQSERMIDTKGQTNLCTFTSLSHITLPWQSTHEGRKLTRGKAASIMCEQIKRNGKGKRKKQGDMKEQAVERPLAYILIACFSDSINLQCSSMTSKIVHFAYVVRAEPFPLLLTKKVPVNPIFKDVDRFSINYSEGRLFQWRTSVLNHLV